MDEGFTLWKIIRKENELPVFRGENGNHLFVHILVLSGELKAEWTGIAGQRQGCPAARSELLVGESRFVVLAANLDLAALAELTEKNLLGEYIANFAHDQPSQRTGAKGRLITLLGEPGTGRGGKADLDFLLSQLILQFSYHLVNHPFDHLQ